MIAVRFKTTNRGKLFMICPKTGSRLHSIR